MKNTRKTLAILIISIVMILGAGKIMAMEVNFDVTPKAKLVKFNLKQDELIKKSSEKMVVFEITIQNIDSVANLYSVTVSMPGIGAAEDFIPVEGEKNLEPKAQGKTSIGIASDKFPPGAIVIKIAEVESR
jgi:hypothetical protein